MAKKKKHRKTRQKKQALSQAQAVVETTAKASRSSKKSSTPKKVSLSPAQTQEDQNVMYVKQDVRRSLLLTAIILGVFGILYFVLGYTSIGTQVYSLIKL